VQHIENSMEGSKMFFSFRSTLRKHWQPRCSRRARAVTRIARAMCEAVVADVHVCVKIARALGFDMLYCSPRLVENRTRTCDVIGFRLCVDHHVATMHFLAAAIFRHRSRTRRRSIYPYDNTHSSE